MRDVGYDVETKVKSLQWMGKVLSRLQKVHESVTHQDDASGFLTRKSVFVVNSFHVVRR